MSDPKKPAELSAAENAINWTKPRLPEAEINALKNAWLSGFNSRTSEVEELREALKYYAEREQWRMHWFRIPMAYVKLDANSPPEEFKGYEVAAKALAKHRASTGGE